jgi:hypothetical protein
LGAAQFKKLGALDDDVVVVGTKLLFSLLIAVLLVSPLYS